MFKMKMWRIAMVLDPRPEDSTIVEVDKEPLVLGKQGVAVPPTMVALVSDIWPRAVRLLQDYGIDLDISKGSRGWTKSPLDGLPRKPALYYLTSNGWKAFDASIAKATYGDNQVPLKAYDAKPDTEVKEVIDIVTESDPVIEDKEVVKLEESI